MKHLHSTLLTALLLPLFLLASFGALAQGAVGTNDDGFVVIITSPASIAQTLPHQGDADPDECYWVGSTYGPSLLEDICGEVVWAYDQTPDSLACDPIPGDLTGKIALIRRGACGFSLKVYRAQQAGAKAVIIVNHFANAADGACINYVPSGLIFGGMSGLDSASAVNIPSVFLQRGTATQIADALKAGQKVNACFSLPRLSNATAALHYGTPLSQVDTMTAITVSLANRNATALTNVVLKADIKAPNGTTQSLTLPIARMEVGTDTFAIFPAYAPPKVKGKFEVIFSNSIYKESRDTLRRFFEHTDFTFATDNFVVDSFGVGLSNADFANAGFFIQNAGLYWTGPTRPAGTKATYATFGLSNVDTIFVPNNPEANQILVTLYDADADDDGFGDMSASSAGASFSDLTVVGTAIYEMKGTEAVDQIVSVLLTDITTGNDGVSLKSNHPYYLSLTYDGTLARTSRCLRFSNTTQEDYLVVGNLLATPLYTNRDGGTLFSGWGGASVIQRLELEGFSSSTKNLPQLDASKISVTPNPAVDLVNVNLRLDAVGEVGVTLVDWTGRAIRSAVQKNFQNGTLQIDTKSLPAGAYVVWVRTHEGYRVEKIIVAK